MTMTTIDNRYQLQERIAGGGMSTVYQAFDLILERIVAVKLMHHTVAGDEDQLERFRREAKAIARLNHPNVVQVIDAGEDNGTAYIVLEYVQGETLKDRIRRIGRMSIDEALAYTIEIARALSVAHRHHIVHRDVKPQNVLLGDDGSTKVTDFGIARALDQEGLTADGRVLGTTDYVSPEQALGHEVDGQSDFYSLGVVLFEMLIGIVPFSGENQVAVAMRHVREELPDVQHLRPEIPASVAAVLEKATAKDLDRRYNDAREMIFDLEQALENEATRIGHTTQGEATAVFETLPSHENGGLKYKLSPRIVVPSVFVISVTAIVLIVHFAIDRTHRGTDRKNVVKPVPGLSEVHLGQKAARDFDPLGDGREHTDERAFIVDGDPNTTWSTETYKDRQLTKAGVGIMVDAKPGVIARRIEIRTPTPGFQAVVYATKLASPKTAPPAGWQKLAFFQAMQPTTKAKLATRGVHYRQYLIWVTKLPPGKTAVKISEVILLR